MGPRAESEESTLCCIQSDDTVRPFRCLAPGCGKAFTRSDLLRRHGQLHGDQQQETGRTEGDAVHSGGYKRAASSASDEPMGKVSEPHGDSPRSRSLQIYLLGVKATEKRHLPLVFHLLHSVSLSRIPLDPRSTSTGRLYRTRLWLWASIDWYRNSSLETAPRRKRTMKA
jgi:hypothetical protein